MALLVVSRPHYASPEHAVDSAKKQVIALEQAKRLGLDAEEDCDQYCYYVTIKAAPEQVKEIIDELEKADGRGDPDIDIYASSAEECEEFDELGVAYCDEYGQKRGCNGF